MARPYVQIGLAVLAVAAGPIAKALERKYGRKKPLDDISDHELAEILARKREQRRDITRYLDSREAAAKTIAEFVMREEGE